MQNIAESDTTEEQLLLKQDVLKRMKRIEGQIRGIQRMIENDKDCEDILMQVKAATSAMQSSSKLIMRRFLLKCLMESSEGYAQDKKELEKLVDAISNYIN